MPTEYTDAQLITACLNGQAWAWDTLVDRYKRLVYSLALRAGLGEEDAADVFQTVFTVLVESLPNLRAPQGLAAWLITTTKRTSWNVLRKRSRELPQSVARQGDAQPNPPTEEWLLSGHPDESTWVDQALVREALERLGGRCKELLQLLYYDPTEPSYEQISQRMRLPLGSIGPTRARCLQKMRKILQAMGMDKA
nr:sigma-70 family RNA polymerase sigma factor [Chloroflexota bacterium]